MSLEEKYGLARPASGEGNGRAVAIEIFLAAFGGSGGDYTQNIEKGGVRGDVKIEVQKAVGQQSGAARQSSGTDSGGGRVPDEAKVTSAFAIEHDQEPDRHCEPDQTGFEQNFQVVIVGVIHEEAVVEDAVLRKGGGKSSETTAQERVRAKHS